MATTPDAIMLAIKNLIEGLTPSGGTASGMETRYCHVSDDVSGWDNRPDTDIDRQFRLLGIQPQRETFFGALDTSEHVATLGLEIGHVCGQYRADRDRRDKDLLQLATQIARAPINATFSAAVSDSVSRIELTGTQAPMEHTQAGNYWITTMMFEINYSANWNYGG